MAAALPIRFGIRVVTCALLFGCVVSVRRGGRKCAYPQPALAFRSPLALLRKVCSRDTQMCFLVVLVPCPLSFVILTSACV